MKLDISTPIVMLDGTPVWATPPISDKDKVVTAGTPMILADVIITACLEPPPPNPNAKPHDASDHIQRYALALATEKAKKLTPPEVEITSELAAELKKDISRLYKTIVAGQVLPLLDGK